MATTAETINLAATQVHKIARAISAANKPITVSSGEADGSYLKMYLKPSHTLLLTIKKKEDYIPAWAYLANAVTIGRLNVGSKSYPIKFNNKTLQRECMEYAPLTQYMSAQSMATVWPILYSRHVLSKNQFTTMRTNILKLLRKNYHVKESCVRINFTRCFAKKSSSESYRYMQKDIYVLVSVRITGATSITDNVSKISPAEKAVLNILETWNTQYKFSYVVNGRLYQSTGKLLATKNQTLIAAINILRHKLPNAVILLDSKNTPQKAPTTQPKQQPKPLRKAQ